jgi:hypothetical protein
VIESLAVRRTIQTAVAANVRDQEEGWPARKLIVKRVKAAKENVKWQDIVMQCAVCAVEKGRSFS